jgi:hypothetical protein
MMLMMMMLLLDVSRRRLERRGRGSIPLQVVKLALQLLDNFGLLSTCFNGFGMLVFQRSN